jgi:hypothetical protein
MLSAIDVFSGIGGFAVALSGGIATTAAFCDIAPAARAVLKKNMDRGLLDECPIYENICDLKGSTDANMVCGGFPCVGYSPLGLSKGFEQPGTKLFYELLRVVDECKADIVFLENVPNIVAHGMTEIAYQLHELRGFDLRWIVLAAYSVGAHHKRSRWFALATKPGLKKAWTGLRYQNHDFNPKDSPPRMVLRGDPAWATRSTRCALLGNSVVPDVVRKAFFILASGFRDADQTAATLFLQEPTRFSRLQVLDETARAFTWPSWGTLDAHRVCSVEPMRFPSPDLRLVLYQDLKKVVPSSRVTTEVIEVYKLRSWSTPRFGNTGSSNTLTVRSARDLPSQLRFEVNTPETLRHGQMSADWIEAYLMGFPAGWTDPQAVAKAEMK